MRFEAEAHCWFILRRFIQDGDHSCKLTPTKVDAVCGAGMGKTDMEVRQSIQASF
jgi:hypothetical protein